MLFFSEIFKKNCKKENKISPKNQFDDAIEKYLQVRQKKLLARTTEKIIIITYDRPELCF